MFDTDTFDLTPYEAPWLILHVLGGQIGLPILVLTALFSKKVHVHPTLINFWATWIIYSTSYLLLIYSGQAHRPMESNFGICLAQAALIHGSPPMAVVSCFILVLHVWSTFHDPESLLGSRPRKWIRTALIIAPPYLVYAIFTMTYGIVGSTQPKAISTDHGSYCTITIDPLHRFVVPGFCLLFMVLIIGFESAVIYNYLHRYLKLKKAFPLLEHKQPSRALMFRVVVFSVYCGAVAAASFMLLANMKSVVPYMIAASIPLAAFFVFGLSRDILLAWFPWERPTEEAPSGPLVADRKNSSASAHAHMSMFSPTDPPVNFNWQSALSPVKEMPVSPFSGGSVSTLATLRGDSQDLEKGTASARSSVETIRPAVPPGLNPSDDVEKGPQ
jgi:hypothetical protein